MAICRTGFQQKTVINGERIEVLQSTKGHSSHDTKFRASRKDELWAMKARTFPASSEQITEHGHFKRGTPMHRTHLIHTTLPIFYYGQ